MFMYIPRFFIFYYLFVPTYARAHARTHTHTHIYIYEKISHYITNAPTCFGGSAPFSGRYDIAFAKVMKL